MSLSVPADGSDYTFRVELIDTSNDLLSTWTHDVKIDTVVPAATGNFAYKRRGYSESSLDIYGGNNFKEFSLSRISDALFYVQKVEFIAKPTSGGAFLSTAANVSTDKVASIGSFPGSLFPIPAV